MLKRTHFSKSSISRFTMYIRKAWSGQLAKISSFQHSKRSDNRKCTVEARWGILMRIWLIFLIIRVVVNIPIQILIILQWLFFHKMIISQLELELPVVTHAWTDKAEFLFPKRRPHFDALFGLSDVLVITLIAQNRINSVSSLSFPNRILRFCESIP